jgi:hypothetical protein
MTVLTSRTPLTFEPRDVAGLERQSEIDYPAIESIRLLSRHRFG